MKKRIRSFLCFLLCVGMIVSTLPGSFVAAVSATSGLESVGEAAEEQSEGVSEASSEEEAAAEEESEGASEASSGEEAAAEEESEDASETSSGEEAAAEEESEDASEAASEEEAAAEEESEDASETSSEEEEENGEEEYLDRSVTVHISAVQDESGNAMTETETGKTLTAVVSAYNDNPNATAEATIRVYVEQLAGNSAISLTETPEVTLTGAGDASAATVETKWNEADIPYLEVTIPAGASIVCALTLMCPTGYDDYASAQIYADVTETDETTGEATTKNAEEGVTFVWTGSAEWDNFTKTADLSVIGVDTDSEIMADAVTWGFSAENETSGSTGVIYTKYITLTDTLTLPEGMTVSDVVCVMDAAQTSATASGKTAVGEIQDAGGSVIYALFLGDDYGDSYTLDSLTVGTNADGLTEISYAVTIDNPNVTDVTFNPVPTFSTALYMEAFSPLAAGVSLDHEAMQNTAELTVYSVMPEESGAYEILYEGTAGSEVTFDESLSLGVEKTVYQVKDGIGNVTYGYGLDTSVDSALSNEKVADDGTPCVAQGYTVTYQVTVSNTFTTATEATMTDTLPSQLTLDEASVRVTSGTMTLLKGVGYTVSTGRDADNNTILTVEIVSVPANGSVVITYSCTVNGTVTASTSIRNTAKVGNKEAEAVVETPEDGTYTFTREIVQRTTTTTTGYTVKIYKDLETDTYHCDATYAALLAYFGISNPSQEELADAILKVNAGDTIEYLITFENNSIYDKYGVIYESNLFSEYTSNSNIAWSYASAMLGSNVGGWSYYSMGCDVYYHTAASDSGENGGYQLLSLTSTQENLLALCKYTYSDLESNSNGDGVRSGTKQGVWQFYSDGTDDYVLHACTTYRQTTLIQIPGDNTLSSAATENAGFQNLVSSYAYYCTTLFVPGYPGYSWADYAFFTECDTAGNVSDVIYTEYYDHTVERQIYLNTGTLASMVVEDVSKLSSTDGLISSYFGSSTLAANDYENSNQYFSADENSVIVNYVYLYNDSSEEMNLSDYNISVVLPNGFEWVGFTYADSMTDDGRVSYHSVLDSLELSKCYYRFPIYPLIVYNTRNGSPDAYAVTNDGTSNNEFYYDGYVTDFPETVPQSQNVQCLYNWDTNANLTCYKSNSNITGSITFSFRASNGNGYPVIAPYNGITIIYAAKISDVSLVKSRYTGTDSTDMNAAATFQAYIQRVYNTEFTHTINSSYCIAQISPVIRAQNYTTSKYIGKYGIYTSNDGNANSYLEHKLDWFYTASSNTLAGGTAANMSTGAAGNPARIWSYVSLSMITEKTSVSVTKEVVKNSGSDYVGQYANGASQSQSYFNTSLFGLLETGGFASDYDDYLWNYSLFDGLHRTVDGTVTWKTTITNTGADISGNTETESSAGVVYEYSTVNYSTLIDTVDSPYHLIEIAVPYLCYVWDTSEYPVSGASGYYTAFRYNWIYYEFPDADPSDPDAMLAAGWEYDSSEDCFYYEAYAKYKNGAELTDLDTIRIAFPYYAVRVTVRCLDDGSLGWGFDADADNVDGNQNTCAYQYLIEFVENLNSQTGGTVVYEPLLVTEEDAAVNSSLRSSVDLYLTFSTDDSIETNYNSFALALKDTSADNVNADEGEITTVSNMHTSTSTASLMSSRSASGSSSYNSSTTGNAGYISSNTVVVQANDWTDTSYTYGEKTLTVLDENGDVAVDDSGEEITINSREDGDMTLPSAVTAGTSLHNTLKWESILYESENYSGITNLVIYDTYGVQADVSSTGDVMSGYDVDFSSIRVRLCLTSDIAANEAAGYDSADDDFVSTELVRGTDYEIYYTTEPLVTTEHHPITVNTLYYAADLEGLETAAWVKYDPDDSDCDGTGAMAFKIVMLDGAAETIWNGRYLGYSDWVQCEIYVDYNSKVSDDVLAGECYPNVMAWTADVIYPTTDGTIYKSILQDTTAMFFEVEDTVGPKLSKTVVNENGNDISSQISSGEEFTYLVFRTNRSVTGTRNLTVASYITGIAAVTIRAGEELYLDDTNLTILYNIYASGDDSAQTFWSGSNVYYYFVEMDSGNYTEKSISFTEHTNVTYNSSTKQAVGGLAAIAVSITAAAADIQAQADAAADADEKAVLEAQAALYEAVAEYVNTSQTEQIVYFKVLSGTTDWSVAVSGTNQYTAPALVIRKVDNNGTVIMNEVKFQLQDSAENVLCFTETSGGYVYEGADGTVTAGQTTTTLVFNGTTSVTGLPEGTYYLVETSAPYGYTLSTEKTEVVVAAYDGDGNQVTTIEALIENEANTEVNTGSLRLTKTDKDTGLAITDGSASFQIYSSNEAGSEPLAFVQNTDGSGNPVVGQYIYGSGTGVTTVSTDETTGTLSISGLPFGTYYLVETDAPDGYLASYSTLATAYSFTIARTEASMEISLPNELILGEITVKKTDEDGNVITGNPASFVLTDEDNQEVTFSYESDGVYTYDTDGTLTTLETSAAGTLTLQGMPEGTYTLTETGAPKGYAVSTEAAALTISDNTKQSVTVQDEMESMRLRIVKTWKPEGSTKTYAFPGVSFTLYQVDSDAKKAVAAASGITGDDGVLDLEDLDWTQTYYLYEEVPDGYASSGTLMTVYRNDSTGEIDLAVTAAADGYTAISCIRVSMSENLCTTDSDGTEYCTYTDGCWTYALNVLNVKTKTYGGLYASTSYKTISNAKSAAVYDELEEETGYSYFYQSADYEEGNYNYVNAIRSGDIVTYTLNVSNVSDYDFSSLVLIDRMPETDDTGIVYSSAARGSEFAVEDPDNIVVTVDGKEVSSALYQISYSKKVKFTDSDFDGETLWLSTAANAKSFRIVFDDTFTLEPGQTLVVTYDGVIGDDAEPGQIAWNNFAYRYVVLDSSAADSASTASMISEEEAIATVTLLSSGSDSNVTGITLTPEPPKVGVLIQGTSYQVTKQWVDDDDALGLRPDAITLNLRVQDPDGNLTDTVTENGTVILKITDDGDGNDVISALIVDGTTTSNVKVKAELDASGSWVCTWSYLPILDSGYSYTVEETDTGSENYVRSLENGVVVNTLKLTTLNLLKQDEEGNTLSGVQFTLEKQATGSAEWEKVREIYTLDDQGTLAATVLTESMCTSGEDGRITIAGLPAGIYRITEVRTLEGYQLLEEPIIVKLPAHYTAAEAAELGIDLSGAEVYENGGEYYVYSVTYTIINKEIEETPEPTPETPDTSDDTDETSDSPVEELGLLPQTGAFWLAVVLLALLGFVCIMIGKRRGRYQDNGSD